MGETHFTLITAEQERPLRNLVADGLIRWGTKDLVIATGSRNGGHALELAVTNEGRKRARRLHTIGGRIELWYEEHKSGALVAALAGLVGLAVFIIDHWHKLWVGHR